jgi:hypothetical protein
MAQNPQPTGAVIRGRGEQFVGRLNDAAVVGAAGVGTDWALPRRGDLDTATQDAYADEHVTVLLRRSNGPHPDGHIRVQITAR